MKTKGLVLAGGKSSRFGQDKALALYNGKRFIQVAVDLLREVGIKPVVVTRQGADYHFLDCPVLLDKFPDKGPLGGLYTAMSVFPETDLLSLTCDMPTVTAAVLLELLSQTDQASFFLLNNDSKPQPFPGIYPAFVFKWISHQLLENQLSMQALLEILPNKRLIPWPDDPAVFTNVNRPNDLEAYKF